MNLLKGQLGNILVILLSGLFVVWNFSSVVWHPSQFLFNTSADGIKNVYTFLWHILYDVELLKSSSMAFPYGDSIFYLDAQPALSIPFQIIQRVLSLEGESWLIVYNYILLLSIPISAHVLYRILRFLEVDWKWSLLFSVGLVLNSPQINRLTGHFTLSYSWIILYGILFLLQYLRTSDLKSYLFLLGITTLGFFIHPYLGAINFLLSFLVLGTIKAIAIAQKKKSISYFKLLGIFLPLILLLFVTFLSDNHIGRVKNPYGFYEYTSSLKGLFLPQGFNFPDWIQYIDKNGGTGEDYNYLGVAGIILLLISLVTLARKIRAGINFESKTMHPVVLLFSSTVLLLFSFGLPFVFGLESIIEKLPFLKAFRALGRFAWPFYFVVSIYGIVQLQSWVSNRNQFLKPLFLSCLSLLFIYEGNRNMSKVSEGINAVQLFDNNISADLSGGYLAILPLPYYNVGSDNYTCEGTNESMVKSMILSLNTAIPLMGNLSARQSIKEAKDLMGLIGRYNYDKTMNSSYFVGKSLLIPASNELLSKHESLLLEKAVEIESSKGLYVLNGEILFDGELKYQERTHDELFFLDFENQKSELAYRGKGSLELKKGGFSKVCDIPKNSFNKGNHILQFWVFTGGKNYGEGRANNCFIVIEEKDENGSVNWLSYAPINDSFVYDGDWCLVEIPFKVKNDEKEMAIQLSGHDKSNMTVIIDELRITKEP